MSNTPVVLAFSGGLDTSFCVPWLRDKGFDVTTLFVDTGGVSADETDYIAQRALELGAVKHEVADVSTEVWNDVVIPMLWGGQWYQAQYPLLCSDRYLIVKSALALCDRLGTKHIAHGCTGMGNDQVRFDLTVATLGDYIIEAPVRELQQTVRNVREYEKEWLAERGFGVRDKTSTYTINENLLGVTISGAEIDEFGAPEEAAWQTTAGRKDWPAEPLQVRVGIEQGVITSIDGKAMSGPAILADLNERFAAYGVGRGLYTGDTTIGLKGRVAFEAPALAALNTAHRALEEACSTRAQNQFKPLAAREWVKLVYEGLFYEPLRRDLEAYLRSTQRTVSGTVTLQTSGAQVTATAIESKHLLTNPKATYAQSADWTVDEATGFIRLFGQSSALWSTVNRDEVG
ncbi:MAG: argininosuccinate synthase domain-containing protein [Gammaproteobacteria bacterium]